MREDNIYEKLIREMTKGERRKACKEPEMEKNQSKSKK